jgi:hypothetical protein
MSKRHRLLLSVLLLVPVLTTMLILFRDDNMLTGEKRDVVWAAITIYMRSNPGKTFEFTDEIQLSRFYNLVCKTKQVWEHPHPDHANSMQADSKFQLEIRYNNGKCDIFYTSEAYGTLYRFLDTFGPAGDQGFIMGRNPELWDYVLSFNQKNAST